MNTQRVSLWYYFRQKNIRYCCSFSSQNISKNNYEILLMFILVKKCFYSTNLLSKKFIFLSIFMYYINKSLHFEPFFVFGLLENIKNFSSIIAIIILNSNHVYRTGKISQEKFVYVLSYNGRIIAEFQLWMASMTWASCIVHNFII